MAGLKERLGELRRRRPVIDHVLRMQEHYSVVKGSALAGAVTFFGFLSFFPILALAFAVVGAVSRVYDVSDQVETAIQSVLPGIVGDEEGQISIDTFKDAAGAAAGIGAVGLLYTGLGWVSGMRDALLVTFEKPPGEQPNFVVGKLKDLVSLVMIGVVLVLSVAVAGLIGSLSGQVLELLRLSAGLEWLVDLVSVAVGLVADMVLFFALFRLLADPETPRRSLWSGALLGAIGFEVLKKVAFVLIASTKDQAAFAVFGVALVLLVWINYFSRVVMYAAAWAHTTPGARALREREALAADRRELELMELARVDLHEAPSSRRVGRGASFAAGGVSMLGLMALFRRRKDDR